MIDTDASYSGTLPVFADIAAYASSVGRTLDANNVIQDGNGNVAVCTQVTERCGLATTPIELISGIPAEQRYRLFTTTPGTWDFENTELGYEATLVMTSANGEVSFNTNTLADINGFITHQGSADTVTMQFTNITPPQPTGFECEDAHVFEWRIRDIDYEQRQNSGVDTTITNDTPTVWQDTQFLQFWSEDSTDEFTLQPHPESGASDIAFGWYYGMTAAQATALGVTDGTNDPLPYTSSSAQVTYSSGDIDVGESDLISHAMGGRIFKGVLERTCGPELLSRQDNIGNDYQEADVLFT